MIAVLLILVPLLAGIAAFFIKEERRIRVWSYIVSLAVLATALAGYGARDAALLEHHCNFLQLLGSSFSIKLDGLGIILTLLTAIAYPLIFTATWDTKYRKPNNFFALMLLTQAGLMGVFLATDALLFYFFWELALIPVYFLCSQWGGEKRIAVTFKFFIYTFVGSLLMLIGIIYLQSKTADHSFSLSSFYKLQTILSRNEQMWLFWLFFIAFAVKMPIFPFHTWQPDTYQQAPTAVTMVLSGVMVKMGLLGLIRWLLPVLTISAEEWSYTVIPLSLIGLIYASLIALRQDDIKKLIAYSSIAHIGMMCAASFANNQYGFQGVMLQMFSHGINIIALWVIVEIIERRLGVTKISELGGLAQRAPAMAVFFVIAALANVALPLTNAFPGEFLMFNGLMTIHSKYYLWFTVLAGLGVILSAAYTLRMVRKVLYGEANNVTERVTDLTLNEKIALSVITAFIFVLGIYPQLLLNVTDGYSDILVEKMRTIRFTEK